MLDPFSAPQISCLCLSRNILSVENCPLLKSSAKSGSFPSNASWHSRMRAAVIMNFIFSPQQQSGKIFQFSVAFSGRKLRFARPWRGSSPGSSLWSASLSLSSPGSSGRQGRTWWSPPRGWRGRRTPCWSREAPEPRRRRGSRGKVRRLLRCRAESRCQWWS